MVVESFTLLNRFYRYVREQRRRINKRDLWKNIFNIVRGSFVPVYMFSFPLVSWLICDVLALFFCLIASPRIQGLPFDLQKGGSGKNGNRDFEEEEEGVRVPYCPERERKIHWFLFLYFLPVLERETWTLWLFRLLQC